MSDTTLPALKKRFELPGVVRFEEGKNGMTKVVVTGAGGEAEVYLHGAHVTHFAPKGERPVLMVSRKSAFQADKPIRGGVPICWPWFGPRDGDATAAIHGFARLTDWDVESVAARGEAVELVFSMHDTEGTRGIWPGRFKLRYTVTVGRELSLALETTNVGGEAFTFTEALHPYFVVKDVREISIGGLENTSYAERIYTPEVQKQGGEAIRFVRRTDRVYYDTRETLRITDPGMKRVIVERKEGSSTTVVWNPGEEWPRTVPDFGEEEWVGMVCVEPSNAHHFGVRLGPGESHTLRAVISVEGM